MLHFDEFGNLIPDQPITSDLSEVETILVFNEHRRQLFESFIDFLEHVQKCEPGNFELWVGGSFITRKINPRDIDLVLFLDHGFYKMFETTLGDFRDRFAPLLDVHYVAVYPPEHVFFVRTEFDRVEYLYLFTKDRLKRRKGLVNLYF